MNVSRGRLKIVLLASTLVVGALICGVRGVTFAGYKLDSNIQCYPAFSYPGALLHAQAEDCRRRMQSVARRRRANFCRLRRDSKPRPIPPGRAWGRPLTGHRVSLV